MNGNIAVFDQSQANFHAWLTDGVNKFFKRTGETVPTNWVGNDGNIKYVRKDLYHRQHLGTGTTVKFFNESAKNVDWTSNVKNSSQGGDRIFAIVGIAIKEAAGDVNAGDDDLDFQTVTTNQIQNAFFSLSVNKSPVLTDMPVSSMFDATDIQGFLRLPNLEIITANNEALLEMTFATAGADKWVEWRLVGYEMGTSVK